MIEVILIILVILLLVSVFGLLMYVQALNNATRDFVVEKINELIVKINQSKLYEFNHMKRKNEYIKNLDKQVRTVSSIIQSDS